MAPSKDPRNRLSSGFSRTRLRLEVKRSLRPFAIVILGLAAALLGAGFIFSNVSPTTLSKTREVRFAVADVTGVVPKAQDIRFKGIPVGRIKSVTRDGTQPVITATYQAKYGNLYKDAHAVLRPATPLQDLYLNVTDRGHASAGVLTDTDVVPATQTDLSVRVDEVLDAFKGDVRQHLRTTLDQLGHGLADGGAKLRASFVEVAPLLRAAGGISHEIAERHALVKSLVHNSAELSGTLADRETQLRTLVQDGSVAVGTLQQGSGYLDALLRELPPTMREVTTSFDAVRGVLPATNAAIADLQPVANELPAALRSLRSLNDTLSPAITSLRQPVGDLVPFAQSLVPVLARARSAVAGLQPQIGSLNRTTVGLQKCQKGVQGFFQWDTSFTKFNDLRGPAPRGEVAIGAQSTGVLTDPGEFVPKACLPGPVLTSRPATPKDFR